MRRGFSIAFLIAVVWLRPCLAGQAPCLFLERAVEVEREQITLRDLARGQCVGSEELEALFDLPLGRSPLPGEARTIERDYLLTRLRQAGFEPYSERIEIPEKICVKRASFEVTAQYLEGLVRAQLLPKLPWNREDVLIKSVRADRDLVLPRGEMEIELGAPRMGRTGGIINTYVLFRVNKTYERRLWLSVVLEVPGEVVATARPLKRNHVICEEDLAVVSANLLDVPAGTVTRPDSLIGKRLRRNLPAHDPIGVNDVEAPDAVRKGEVVTLLARSDTVRIKGLGTARQSGRIGDWIKVANLDSGKEISARVVEAGVVAVDF